MIFIKRIKDMTKAMMDGLATKGYYEFENGNIISAYIWTKLVDAKTIYGHRLTAQCPTDKVNDPVLYPGWRGQKDNWEEMGLNYGSSTPATNLAIKGLFEIVSEEEAASLESQSGDRGARSRQEHSPINSPPLHPLQCLLRQTDRL